MAVATSTIAIAALVGGMALKTKLDADKAKREQKALGGVLETPPVPMWQQPKMAEAIRLQRTKATGKSGRAGTIKTGPSGIEPGKTLLGD